MYNFKLVKSFDKNKARFIVECGKGVYIRSLARDLANYLNTYGHISYLKRLSVGTFLYKDAILLADLANLVDKAKISKVIKPISFVLDDIPVVQLNRDLSKKFRNGLNFDYFNEDIFEDTLLIISDEKLLGIGKVIEGKIKPVRVFNL